MVRIIVNASGPSMRILESVLVNFWLFRRVECYILDTSNKKVDNFKSAWGVKKVKVLESSYIGVGATLSRFNVVSVWSFEVDIVLVERLLSGGGKKSR